MATVQNLLSQSNSLLKWYVYVLAHPVDNRIFYVGMGQNDRVLHHWQEVRLKIRNGAMLNHPKQIEMLAIADLGREPIQIVVGRYETQAEAFAVETTLINWVYGFDELTNLNRGQGADFVRPKGNWYSLENIDVIPKEREDNDMVLVPIEDLLGRHTPAAASVRDLARYVFNLVREKVRAIHQVLLSTACRRLEFRSTTTRITYFLGEGNRTYPTEQRNLPYPICRIHVQGNSTTNSQLHLEFTKADAVQAADIFRQDSGAPHDLSGSIVRSVSAPGRYDLLVPALIDRFELDRVVGIALSHAIRNAIEP